MFRRGRLSNIEKDLMYFIKGYFKDLLADFDVYKPVYETLITKTMMEPSIEMRARFMEELKSQVVRKRKPAHDPEQEKTSLAVPSCRERNVEK